MDREKIIKEMETILEQEQIKIANTVEEFAKLQKVGITRCNAEALYNANCQVIPEGAIVLTREEMETTDKIPQKIKEFYKWFIEIEKEQVRKETLMKFATNFENYLCDVNTDYCTDDTVPEALYTSIDIDKVMGRTLKDFGVEVE